jgi:hypothetical protein
VQDPISVSHRRGLPAANAPRDLFVGVWCLAFGVSNRPAVRRNGENPPRSPLASGKQYSQRIEQFTFEAENEVVAMIKA